MKGGNVMFSEEEMYYDGPDPDPLQGGDQLFINDQAQLQLDALENYSYGGYKIGTWFHYASAYREAANRLIQTLRGRSSDELTLPIVFLYRHYVELTLKDLVSMGNKKYSKPSTPDFEKRLESILNGHRIDLLWQELKPLLRQLYPPSEKSGEIEVVEACLLEFSKVDESSMSFRYPVDKKHKQPILQNNPHLQHLAYIDVHHLAEKMAAMAGFFMSSYMAFLSG